MGRKNKNILGGVASGAAAGSAAGPYGAIAGGILGGLLGSQEETDARQLAPAVPQEVVDRLYRQSAGAEPTVGELKAAQLYDKTLAQQIAAAKASRGTNPALLQRNVARIAAEQSQANAAAAAEMAAQERAKAMQQYLAAQQLNAGVATQNLAQEQAMDKKSDAMFGAGLNAAAGAAALYAQKSDAAKQLAEQEMQKSLVDSSKQSQDLAKAYSMGAQDTYGPSNGFAQQPSSMLRGVSDYRQKKDVMKVTSDERQKDLVKTEDLPQNNNMGMQNMQAQQPAAPMTQAPQPQMQQQQMPVQVEQAPQTKQVPSVQFGLTPEMLAQAQKSSKSGGNVADIQNQGMTLSRAAEGPTEDEIRAMTLDAQRRQRRDMFGNVIQSDKENYAANLARWYAARDAQNAAYDEEAGQVAQANQLKDLQRTARLNRFYTGVDTNTGAVASQFAPRVAMVNSDWQTAQEQTKDWAVNNPYAYRQRVGGVVSDENQKTSKDKKDKNFNPKSFLDKLEAVSYEYKDSAKGLPGVSEGRKLGIMAQDLEKAGPVGESMVQEDTEGNKVVDYATGFNAILASQAHLNKRLQEIEKMYSKKKKES